MQIPLISVNVGLMGLSPILQVKLHSIIRDNNVQCEWTDNGSITLMFTTDDKRIEILNNIINNLQE